MQLSFFRADALNSAHSVIFDTSAKASASWAKIFKLGIAAGCHIGFGSYLAITVGGACPQIAEANPGLQKVSEFMCVRIISVSQTKLLSKTNLARIMSMFFHCYHENRLSSARLVFLSA